MPPCATTTMTPTRSRGCSPRTRYGTPPPWAGPRGARQPGASFEGASGIFSFAIHYSLNGHIEVEGDQARARWYFVHALHGGGRQPGDVARRYRSRDLRAGGWSLDVPPQAIRAADERPVRDRLGQGAVCVIPHARAGHRRRPARTEDHKGK